MAQDHGEHPRQRQRGGNVQLRPRRHGHRRRRTPAARSPASCSARPTTRTSTYRAVPSCYPRQHAWILHAGDSWRVNNKLTLDYGLRWDYYSPSSEKYDGCRSSIPIGANPGAGGRPGRLAFAGDGYGAASYGAPLSGKELVRRVRAARSAPSTRSTTRRSSAAGGASSTRRRSIPAGAAACSQDGFSNDADRATRRGGGIAAGHVPGSGLPVRQFAPPPDHPLRLQERAGHLLPAHRRQQAAVHAPVEHHGGSRARRITSH